MERDALITGAGINAGDVMIALASNGPHSNGYSLIRKVLATAENTNIDGEPADRLCMQPTRIYVRPLLAVMQDATIKGMAHITGGGLTENLPRILPDGLQAAIDIGSWQRPAVFDWLAVTGRISHEEMRRTFNCGVGMVIVVSEHDVETALEKLAECGESAWVLGNIEAGDEGVAYR